MSTDKEILELLMSRWIEEKILHNYGTQSGEKDKENDNGVYGNE